MAYQTINEIFNKNESDLTASEAHGLATGMLCMENRIEMARWLRELFPHDVVLLEEDKMVLEALFERTRQLLHFDESSFRFDLFLPSDDDILEKQLIAVRSWCEGFLFGIGYTRTETDWPKETEEIMRDIVEFTKLDANVDEYEEMENVEEELMEIQEYLRMAVLLIRDQFNTMMNKDEV